MGGPGSGRKKGSGGMKKVTTKKKGQGVLKNSKGVGIKGSSTTLKRKSNSDLEKIINSRTTSGSQMKLKSKAKKEYFNRQLKKNPKLQPQEIMGLGDIRRFIKG